MSPAGHPSDAQLDVATWCRHLIPDGSVYAFLADHRHQLVPPELFVDVARQGGGHPSVPAEVVATVMVLQAVEGLSDREVISALRCDIAWKVACELRLDDEGFTPRCWCTWDDLDTRQALVSGLVNDALAALDAVAEVELGADQAEVVALLALVAGQDVESGERPGSWRIARGVARDRVISTVDPQARHARKTSAPRRDGYKGPHRCRTGDRAGDRVWADRRQPSRRADRPAAAGRGGAGLGGAGRIHHPRLPDRPAG
jgi:Transposase domain (DUF772)